MIDPDVARQVEGRLNRQVQPVFASPSMGMSSGVVVNTTQTRPPSKTQRERRLGLATLPEGLRFGGSNFIIINCSTC